MSRWWFRPKRYGYGATPCSWEGWAATLAVVIAVTAVAHWVPFLFHDAGVGVLAAVAIAALIIGLFVWLAWKKTEGGWRWRWGDED